MQWTMVLTLVQYYYYRWYISKALTGKMLQSFIITAESWKVSNWVQSETGFIEKVKKLEIIMFFHYFTHEYISGDQ